MCRYYVSVSPVTLWRTQLYNCNCTPVQSVRTLYTRKLYTPLQECHLHQFLVVNIHSSFLTFQFMKASTFIEISRFVSQATLCHRVQCQCLQDCGIFLTQLEISRYQKTKYNPCKTTKLARTRHTKSLGSWSFSKLFISMKYKKIQFVNIEWADNWEPANVNGKWFLF